MNMGRRFGRWVKRNWSEGDNCSTLNKRSAPVELNAQTDPGKAEVHGIALLGESQDGEERTCGAQKSAVEVREGTFR